VPKAWAIPIVLFVALIGIQILPDFASSGTMVTAVLIPLTAVSWRIVRAPGGFFVANGRRIGRLHFVLWLLCLAALGLMWFGFAKEVIRSSG